MDTDSRAALITDWPNISYCAEYRKVLDGLDRAVRGAYPNGLKIKEMYLSEGNMTPNDLLMKYGFTVKRLRGDLDKHIQRRFSTLVYDPGIYTIFLASGTGTTRTS